MGNKSLPHFWDATIDFNINYQIRLRVIHFEVIIYKWNNINELDYINNI